MPDSEFRKQDPVLRLLRELTLFTDCGRRERRRTRPPAPTTATTSSSARSG